MDAPTCEICERPATWHAVVDDNDAGHPSDRRVFYACTRHARALCAWSPWPVEQIDRLIEPQQ